jgi:hypothetical protein
MAAIGVRTLRGLAAKSCAASRAFHTSRISRISLTRPMLIGGSGAVSPAVASEADTFSPAAASEIFDRASAEQLGAKLLADVTLGVKPDAEKAEIKDARIIFDMVWREVVKRHGIEKMTFPREVVWLSGAPGAGKGTMASFILKEREIPHMFEVSSLLGTPEMRKKKEAGVLIGDLEVVMAVRCAVTAATPVVQEKALSLAVRPRPDDEAPSLLELSAVVLLKVADKCSIALE